MVGLVASLLALSAAPAVALRYSPVPRAGAGPGRCPSQPSKPGPAITGLAEHKLAGSFDQRKAAARDIGQKAYVYGFPLVDEDRILDTLRTTPGAGVNRFIDVDRLGSPGDRTVVAPNSDTLYSLAELDVRDEPIVLSVPSTGGRWYDMELVEPYTNVFGYVGQRVSGTHAGDYAVVGPHWGGKVPKGMRCVRAPADRVWLIGRTLVAGPTTSTRRARSSAATSSPRCRNSASGGRRLPTRSCLPTPRWARRATGFSSSTRCRR